MESSGQHHIPAALCKTQGPSTHWIGPTEIQWYSTSQGCTNIRESSVWNLIRVTFWHRVFWDASHIFGNFVHPCYMDTWGSKYIVVLQLGKHGKTQLSLLLILYSTIPQIVHSWPTNLPVNSPLSLLLHAARQFPSFLGQGLFTLTQWHQP